MIESFKNFINTLLCLGIFITILQLVAPKNKLKKYIYSLMGIIVIISIISPVINILNNESFEEGINEVIANLDSYQVELNNNENQYINSNEETIKNQVILNMKSDIDEKLSKRNIKANDVEIYLEDNYDIKKIKICIDNLKDDELLFSNINTIVKNISEEYQIDYSKIEVIEEGVK